MVIIGPRPIISGRGHARKICGNPDRVGLVKQEGAGPAQTSHEQTKFKYYIVTWAEAFDVADAHEVIWCNHEYSKIESRKPANERLDECGTQLEEAFIPECYLNILIQ